MTNSVARFLRGVALTAGSSLAIFGCATAQTFQCASPSIDGVTGFKDAIVRVVTSSDSNGVRKRAQYNLPKMAANKIALVTTTATCATAAQAFFRAAGGTAPSGPVNVVVLKAGSTRYVVTVLGYTEGEFNLSTTFDAKWHALARINY